MWRENIRLALGSLWQNRLRSFLTLLGMIIGIASVVMILSVSAGIEKQLLNSIASSGFNDVRVSLHGKEEKTQDANQAAGMSPDGSSTGDGAGDGFVDGADDGFGEDEFAMEDPGYEDAPMMDMFGNWSNAVPLPDDIRITPEIMKDVMAELGDKATGYAPGQPVQVEGEALFDDKRTGVALNAINADYQKLSFTKIAYGRAITGEDVTNKAQVAVLPNAAAERLFASPGDAIGKIITFQSDQVQPGLAGFEEFVVIGVTAAPMPGMGGWGRPELLVPMSVVDAVAYNAEEWTEVALRPAPGTDATALNTAAQLAMSRFIDDPRVLVRVTDFSQGMKEFTLFMDVLRLGLAGIAGLSLLVGGIGVMNIMLVTVTERTREIGIRKALGAKNKDIRKQFVVEAMAVSFLGGLIGVILGGLGGMTATMAFGALSFPPISAVLGSLLFSIAIGLFFGIYPAMKAAKLNPIDALRYE